MVLVDVPAVSMARFWNQGERRAYVVNVVRRKRAMEFFRASRVCSATKRVYDMTRAGHFVCFLTARAHGGEISTAHGGSLLRTKQNRGALRTVLRADRGELFITRARKSIRHGGRQKQRRAILR
jgi:hypothetical protein